MQDFHDKINRAKTSYLDSEGGSGEVETRSDYVTAGGNADQHLEQIVFTRFLDPECSQGFLFEPLRK